REYSRIEPVRRWASAGRNGAATSEPAVPGAIGKRPTPATVAIVRPRVRTSVDECPARRVEPRVVHAPPELALVPAEPGEHARLDVEIETPIALVLEARPSNGALAVRVSASREPRPVAADRLAKRRIVGGRRCDRAEHVDDLRAVERLQADLLKDGDRYLARE